MKRHIEFAGLLLVMLMSACNGPVSQTDGVSMQYPAENLAEDTYEPGEGWRLAWADEFDGGAIDETNWSMQVVDAGRFNDEWQRYVASSENAYIDNHCLVIRAVHESDRHGKDQYTSARLHTANKRTFKYGKIAARMQLPYGNGMWPAFWMLGANIDENGGDTPWPRSGEIDIVEFYGSKDNAVVEANIHYEGANGRHANMGAVRHKLDDGVFAEAFHVFELEWGPESMTWFVDGEKFAETSIVGEEFSELHKDFFILLNLAVGGRHSGRPDNSTRFPQYLYVDWVRVYQRD